MAAAPTAVRSRPATPWRYTVRLTSNPPSGTRVTVAGAETLRHRSGARLYHNVVIAVTRARRLPKTLLSNSRLGEGFSIRVARNLQPF
jgi:hypothetical protein